MKARIRRYGLSIVMFLVVLAGLVSFDDRVRDRARALIDGRHAVASVGRRTNDLVEAVSAAVRTQSIENGPLLVFATVGGLLFVFMYRT